MADPLNRRRAPTMHAAFVREYLASPTMNATEAALAAGYGGKNKDRRSAARVAANLMKRPEIIAQIEAGIAGRSKRTQIDADWLLRQLAEEAQADLNDLYDELGALKPVKDWPLIWRQGLVTGIETTKNAAGHVVTKVKYTDRLRVKELLGKHVEIQAWREKVEHKHTFEQMSDEEIERQIAAFERGENGS